MVTVLMNGVQIFITGQTCNIGLKITLEKIWKNVRMKKPTVIFICCVCMSWSTAVIPSFALEKPDTFKTSHLSLGVGWEVLNYSEHEPDSHLDSDANVSNRTLGLDAFKQRSYIFCRLKGIIPVHRGDDSEKWRVSDILTQQNTLKYGWTRIDAIVGYPLNSYINPYMGLRWSDSAQKRSEFVVLGTPIEGRSTEDVTAWFITFGIRGDIPFKPRWRLSYSGSFFVPVHSEVENSSLPGWEVTDTDGHAFEFEGRAVYAYTGSISFVFKLYGGTMHWNGSDWIPFSGTRVKWPENDTRYFGGMLSIRWLF
jgi:hypothetical protein